LTGVSFVTSALGEWKAAGQIQNQKKKKLNHAAKSSLFNRRSSDLRNVLKEKKVAGLRKRKRVRRQDHDDHYTTRRNLVRQKGAKLKGGTLSGVGFYKRSCRGSAGINSGFKDPVQTLLGGDMSKLQKKKQKKNTVLSYQS